MVTRRGHVASVNRTPVTRSTKSPIRLYALVVLRHLLNVLTRLIRDHRKKWHVKGLERS